MKLSQQSLSNIESTIRKAVGKYVSGGDLSTITDFYLQPNPESGQFAVFNDDDEKLAGILIEEWISDQGEHYQEKTEEILLRILSKMKAAGDFDRLAILKPYSFVMVDEEKETITELLLMDDDTLLVSQKLLEGLDEELDSFLKELLET